MSKEMKMKRKIQSLCLITKQTHFTFLFRRNNRKQHITTTTTTTSTMNLHDQAKHNCNHNTTNDDRKNIFSYFWVDFDKKNERKTICNRVA